MDRAAVLKVLAAPVLLLLAFAPPALGGAEKCGGADMLAELATSDPAIHESIRAEAEKLENAASIFWKVERSGAAPSYLFGTMHLSDPRIATLPPAAEKALLESKIAVLEVADTSAEAMSAAMFGQSQLIFYSDGRSLADALSPEDFKKVEGVAASAGVPAELAKMMRPWLVSTLLSTSECERAKMASGAPVLDLLIAEKAKEKGIAVTGLETVDQQLGAMAAIPEDQQLEILKVGLIYLDRRNDMLETMLQLYLKRQMGAAMPFQIALAKKAGIDRSAFKDFEKILLTDRNASMSKTAQPILAKGGAFIAVGALHLPGKDGLVALLRNEGYTLTPLD